MKAHQWTTLWTFLLTIWFHCDFEKFSLRCLVPGISFDLWWSCLASVVNFAWTSNNFDELEELVSFNVNCMLCKLARKSWRYCEKQICTDGFGPKNCGEIAEGILRKAANKVTLQRSWSKQGDPNKLAKPERCDIRVSFRSQSLGPKVSYWFFCWSPREWKSETIKEC